MDQDASGRAFAYLLECGLMTPAGQARGLRHPEWPNIEVRTPGEALAWAASRGVIALEDVAYLTAAVTVTEVRQKEAQGIVNEANDLLTGAGSAPARYLFDLRMVERRMEYGVSLAALKELCRLGLIDQHQLDLCVPVLPIPQDAWAATDSLSGTLAWIVRSEKVFSKAAFHALVMETNAEPEFGGANERKKIVAAANERVERVTEDIREAVRDAASWRRMLPIMADMMLGDPVIVVVAVCVLGVVLWGVLR